MKYNTTTHSYIFLLTSIIFTANINFSYAETPSYECFTLANDSQYKKYDISIASDKILVEDHQGVHVGTGWLMPGNPPFIFSITDKNNKKRIEVRIKEHLKTIMLDGPGDSFIKLVEFEKYHSGYFINAQDIWGTGLHIRGCGNASSFNKIYSKVMKVDTQKREYKGKLQCCILDITS